MNSDPLAGAMSRWFKTPKNQHEASGSSGQHTSLPPPPPPPAAFGIAPDGVRVLVGAASMRRASAADPAPKKKRMRCYLCVDECQ